MDLIKSVHKLKNVEYKLERLASRGIFFLPGPIDDVVANSFALETLSFMIDRDKENKEPVWVVIDSPGGEVYSGFLIYDTIRMMVGKGIEVNTLCLGLAASMAGVISQAGVRRCSSPNTRFLIHKAFMTQGVDGENEDDLEKRKAELKKVSDCALAIISARCGMKLEEVRKLFNDKRDLWLDAKEARELGPNGLIDEIVTTFPFNL